MFQFQNFDWKWHIKLRLKSGRYHKYDNQVGAPQNVHVHSRRLRSACAATQSDQSSLGVRTQSFFNHTALIRQHPMCRLTWVFAGGSCYIHVVGFVMLWLISEETSHGNLLHQNLLGSVHSSLLIPWILHTQSHLTTWLRNTVTVSSHKDICYLWNIRMSHLSSGLEKRVTQESQVLDRQVWTNGLDPDQTAPQCSFEAPHDKTNKMTCAPSEDSDQPVASAQSDQSSLCAQWVAEDPMFLHVDSEDSDQTGRMPRLIWVFAGHTCHFVGFLMRLLIYTLW